MGAKARLLQKQTVGTDLAEADRVGQAAMNRDTGVLTADLEASAVH